MNEPTVHDADAPTVAGDPSTFPTHAELVRTLLADGGFGSLTTLTESGHPYGSLVAFSTLGDGSVLVCISEMAEHTRNARRDARAGLFVATRPAAGHGSDPLDEPRASIIGDLSPHDATSEEIERHLAVHPQTARYADFADFGWWRLALMSARFVGGFGSMSWVTAEEVATATADPVSVASRGAVDHMNSDHATANLEIVRRLAGIESARAATVHAIDRHGITLYADTDDGVRMARIGFETGPLDDPADVRSAVVQLVQRARERGGRS